MLQWERIFNFLGNNRTNSREVLRGLADGKADWLIHSSRSVIIPQIVEKVRWFSCLVPPQPPQRKCNTKLVHVILQIYCQTYSSAVHCYGRVRDIVVCGFTECISCRIVIVVIVVRRCDLVSSSSTTENGFCC